MRKSVIFVLFLFLLLPCCASSSFPIGSFEDQAIGPLFFGQDDNRTLFTFVPNGAGGFVFVLKMMSPRLSSSVTLYSSGAHIVQLEDRETFDSPIIPIPSKYIAQRDNTFTYVARCLNGRNAHREVAQVVTLDAASPFGNSSIAGDGVYSGPAVFSQFDSMGTLRKYSNVYKVSHRDVDRVDPIGNRLDLSSIRIEYKNPAMYNSMCGKAEVRLLDHTDDFRVGTIFANGAEKYRRFDGVIKYNAPRGQSPFFTMALKTKYALDRRNLTMKPLAEKNGNDGIADSIYLPTGLGKVNEIYRFLVCFYEMNCTGDYLYFVVSLSRSREHFGTCPLGDYCLEIGAGRKHV